MFLKAELKIDKVSETELENRHPFMTNLAYSINNIPIRLTDERWRHIVENHDDLASYYYEVLETVTNPTYIFEGDEGELWAVKHLSQRKALLVMYKELPELKDGFIITAFFTTQLRKLMKRRIIWQSPQP